MIQGSIRQKSRLDKNDRLPKKQVLARIGFVLFLQATVYRLDHLALEFHSAMGCDVDISMDVMFFHHQSNAAGQLNYKLVRIFFNEHGFNRSIIINALYLYQFGLLYRTKVPGHVDIYLPVFIINT